MGVYSLRKNSIGAKFWVIMAAAGLLFMLLHPLTGGILQLGGGHTFQPETQQNPGTTPEGNSHPGPSVSANAMGGSAFTSGYLGGWINSIFSSGGGSGPGGALTPNSPNSPNFPNSPNAVSVPIQTWPVINSINPNSGPKTGGTVVAINGSGFTGVTGVNFGTTSALSYTFNSDSSITASSPGGSGTVDVRVITDVGTSNVTPADQFTYTGQAVPSVPEFPTLLLPLAGIISFIAMIHSLRKGNLSQTIGNTKR